MKETQGQMTNEYILWLQTNTGNVDGKGFGLLNTYSNIPSSPEFEVKMMITFD